MKTNAKTTIIGLLAAAAAAIQIVVQQGKDITDWKTWLLPVTLAILGYLAKDATPVEPPPAETKKKLDPFLGIFLVLFACLLFTGCQGLTATVSPDGSVKAEYRLPAPITYPSK